VQYGGAVAVNASVWFWTVDGWMLEFANDLFNTNPAPFVVSMSWGWPEDQQCQITSCNGLTSQQYVQRTNTEWQKIGARGITLLASSGDQGAPGDANPNCLNSAEPISTIFPGASPWVTSVGATMFQPPSSTARLQSDAAPPICSQFDCADPTWPEVACSFPDALITSGGGFSDYSPMPSWQSKEVGAYLSSAIGLPDKSYFNSTNRGFPDISALGHNYLIYLSGRWGLVDGTSCSSPVIGGMVALWNDWLLNNNYSTIGFMYVVLFV
jgi:subtilase family serine protease